MKTLRQTTPAPKINITNEGPGKREVIVDLGGFDGRPASDRDPDFVHVNIADPSVDGLATPQQGTIFLGLTLGTVAWDGQRSFREFDGCIVPEQLDRLIACLCFARDEAATLGLCAQART